MRLYLNADGEKHIGYAPDWLRIDFEQDDHKYELTLDVQGWIDYNREKLECRVKGELTPWVLRCVDTDKEIDLYELDEEFVNLMFSTKQLYEIFDKGADFTVGIYPASDDNLEIAEDDKLTDCLGTVELYFDGEEYRKDFEFEVEFNG